MVSSPIKTFSICCSYHNFHHIQHYNEASERILALLRRFTPHVERGSIDEAFLDVSEQVQTRIAQMAKEDQRGDYSQVCSQHNEDVFGAECLFYSV